MYVGILISDSSAISKSSLTISKFSVYILLKPSLKDFEHNLAGMRNECDCMIIWTFFGIAFLWDWDEKWPFPVLGHCCVFQIHWHNECSTLMASFLRFLNSSAISNSWKRGWNKLRVEHWNICIVICKTASEKMLYNIGSSTGALWQPRGSDEGGVGERFKRQRICVYYGWFTLLYGRNQHNIAEQLSSN